MIRMYGIVRVNCCPLAIRFGSFERHRRGCGLVLNLFGASLALRGCTNFVSNMCLLSWRALDGPFVQQETASDKTIPHPPPPPVCPPTPTLPGCSVLFP